MTTQGSVHPEFNVAPARKVLDGRSTTETLEAAGSDLKARAGELLEHGRSRASELLRSGRTRVTEWKGGFQEGVREKPIQSILIAAAVGAVIGLIVGRRSS